MIRLVRLIALSAIPCAVAAVMLLVMLAAPVGPNVAVAAVPNLISPSPTPTSSPCPGCVSPQDAICWEDARCPDPVKVMVVVPHTITVHYRTVPMTAKPGIDYIPVSDAVLTIPAGQTIAYVYVQLLPDPGMTQNLQFAIAFYDIVGGQLTRPQAIVTITPPGGPN
jgi:hypothetical protein